jgi:beta-glucosidase
MKLRAKIALAGLAVTLSCPAFTAYAQSTPDQTAAQNRPWMNKQLSPDERADLVIQQMTLDEKIQLVHGSGWGALRAGSPILPGNDLGAGYTPGIERLGIPGINEADSAVGVRLSAIESRYSTLLPSTLGAAASWDPAGAYLYGQVIGRELRAQGFNMSIGGGVDLTREPRNGRNFEYAGEDPVLAGTMVGTLEKGVQSQQVMGDIKHYAMNDQETGRNVFNAIIDKRSMRETDLLAFQIAIGIAHPAGVMCSYNKVNGDHSCENDYLLNQVLKKDWGFKGFLLSDWMATHSTVKAALAGLDQEQPGDEYFGAALRQAVLNGQVPMSRLNDMVHRILRSMFAVGVIDNPPMPREVVDPFRGRDDAQHIAEESITLLKNQDQILPLSAGVQSIALIGSHADKGVLSGGGSAQVDPPGGNAIDPQPGTAKWGEVIYFPSSPLRYIREHAPQAKINFNEGTDEASAAEAARNAQVAIVFVNQPEREGQDSATLSLPDNQDALVSAVAAANPHTIVVVESGGPVTMPWIENVAGVIEAWYPGIGGAQALANLMFGTVDFSAHLPLTFPRSDDQLPHPQVIGIDLKPVAPPTMPEAAGSKNKHHAQTEYPPFDVKYTEGMRFGYHWFESEHKQPLFAFGYGLSYTSFGFSGLTADQQSVTFTVRNTGDRAGTEVAQVYVELPQAANEPFKRLVAFERVPLQPGESKQVTLAINPTYMSVFDTAADHFRLEHGDYKVFVGGSSDDTPLTASFHVE